VSVAFQAPTVKERDLINSHAGAAWKGLVRSKLPKRDGLRPSPSRVAPEFQFEKKRAPPDTKHSDIRPYADEDQPIDMPCRLVSARADVIELRDINLEPDVLSRFGAGATREHLQGRD
jgi:hypothetical protein